MIMMPMVFTIADIGISSVSIAYAQISWLVETVAIQRLALDLPRWRGRGRGEGGGESRSGGGGGGRTCTVSGVVHLLTEERDILDALQFAWVAQEPEETKRGEHVRTR